MIYIVGGYVRSLWKYLTGKVFFASSIITVLNRIMGGIIAGYKPPAWIESLFVSIIMVLFFVANVELYKSQRAEVTQLANELVIARKPIATKKFTTADFRLDHHGTVFGFTSMEGFVPLSPFHFRVTLEAINPGPETVLLLKIAVVKFQMNTTLLGKAPFSTRLLLTRVSQVSLDIELPYRFKPKDRQPNLVYEIQVELKSRSALDLASRICEFDKYAIELAYSFNDAQSETFTKNIQIDGSFVDFRRARVNDWFSNITSTESRELYTAAKDAGCGLGV